MTASGLTGAGYWGPPAMIEILDADWRFVGWIRQLHAE